MNAPMQSVIRLIWKTQTARAVCVFLFLALACERLTAQEAQPPDHAFGATLRFNSSSQIYLRPFSSDPSLQYASLDLGSSLSYGVQYGYTFSPSIHGQLTGEYLPASHSMRDNYGTEIKDGCELFALELTGLFTLPFSGRTVKMYVGGGGGMYTGTRSYSVAGLASRSVNAVVSFGIHATLGLEVAAWERISFRGGLLFRDPQVTAQNVFDQPSVRANGVDYPLDTTPFSSRINFNGNVYSLGVAIGL